MSVVPSPGFSSLDHSETSEHPLERQSGAQRKLHARWSEVRRRTVDGFVESGDAGLAKRAAKLGMCCVSPLVSCRRGQAPRCIPGRCRDRCCQLCQYLRGREVQRKMRDRIASASSLRMVTLTASPESKSLGACVDKLMSSFRELRRSCVWKRTQRGGVAVVEVTRGSAGDHWHVHLHVLVDGGFVRQAELQAAWSKSVGRESICHITMVRERRQAARYITKYLAKGTDAESWSPAVIAEYALGLHRRRTITSFGTWHRLRVEREEPEPTLHVHPRVEITFASLVEAMRCGTVDASRVVPALCRLDHLWRLLLGDWVRSEWALDADADARDAEAVVDLAYALHEIKERGEPPPRPHRQDVLGAWSHQGV